MSYFYQVTLNQGRSDTLTVEADSLLNVKTFFQTVSTANITSIKKIVYSKDLGIGTAITTYIYNNQNKYLNILVRTDKGYTSTINISFPIKNLTKDNLVQSVKKNLLINGDKIVSVIDHVVSND